ncbi:MAG TPA: hypothetical protein VNS55_11755 [Nocardioides sp.]|nr:hypothetical protein [Nocardioides sp.]
MKVEHSWASRSAVVVTAALALVQLAWVLDGGDALVVTVGGFLGLLTALATAKMARDNCFESRLAACSVASIQVAAVALAATLGLPGAEHRALSGHLALAGALAAAVLVLVPLDRLARSHGRGHVPPPYAL